MIVGRLFACGVSALAVVVLAACDSTLDIRVWQRPNGTVAEIYDADCECAQLAAPYIGQCGGFDDVKAPACSCDAPSTCLERARIERDGATVATAEIPGASGSRLVVGLQGDFVGASLVLEGCDEEIRVQLADEYPAAPTATVKQDGTGKTDVTWSSVPDIDFVVVRAGALYGQWCVVRPTQTSITLRGSGGAKVTAVRERAVEPTALGELRAYSATAVDAQVQF